MSDEEDLFKFLEKDLDFSQSILSLEPEELSDELISIVNMIFIHENEIFTNWEKSNPWLLRVSRSPYDLMCVGNPLGLIGIPQDEELSLIDEVFFKDEKLQKCFYPHSLPLATILIFPGIRARENSYYPDRGWVVVILHPEKNIVLQRLVNDDKYDLGLLNNFEVEESPVLQKLIEHHEKVMKHFLH